MRKFEGLNRRELLTVKAALDLARNEFIKQAELHDGPNAFWLKMICTRGALIDAVGAELNRRYPK